MKIIALVLGCFLLTSCMSYKYCTGDEVNPYKCTGAVVAEVTLPGIATAGISLGIKANEYFNPDEEPVEEVEKTE